MSTIYSFGLRYGKSPVGATPFSALTIPNPDRSINIYSGKHPIIQKYVLNNPKSIEILDKAKKVLETGNDVAFACQFGCHRSVALAELLHKMVPASKVMHRDLHRHKKIHESPPASKGGAIEDPPGSAGDVGLTPAGPPPSKPEDSTKKEANTDGT